MPERLVRRRLRILYRRLTVIDRLIRALEDYARERPAPLVVQPIR